MTVKSVLVKENVMIAVNVNEEQTIHGLLEEGFSLIRVQVCKD